MKIKKGDNVKVMAGKERGKVGKILQVLPEERSVVVEKLNPRVRHLRARQNAKGQRVEFNAPIPASNIMLLCPKCQKPTRVGYVILPEGNKVRRCLKCKEQIA